MAKLHFSPYICNQMVLFSHRFDENILEDASVRVGDNMVCLHTLSDTDDQPTMVITEPDYFYMLAVYIKELNSLVEHPASIKMKKTSSQLLLSAFIANQRQLLNTKCSAFLSSIIESRLEMEVFF